MADDAAKPPISPTAIPLADAARLLSDRRILWQMARRLEKMLLFLFGALAASENPTMPLLLEQFIQQLESSGIVSGDTLEDFIPPKAPPKDAQDLARELVRQKKLTEFQVHEVLAGNAKSLVLGHYVLLEKIGAGSMGQVFKAEHRRMKRVVAIKILPPHLTQDKASIARFEREVEAAAKLRHPNIVAADDADCSDGVHFLVMELVDGSDLSAFVKQNGPLSVDQAVDYALQAAKGLEAAHRVGIVHRDVKPSNLLLDKNGTVKILDLGLARLNGDVDTPTQSNLTSTGIVMGTVDYMAPEQAVDTKNADARADIYALGCTLYYLLIGKPLYEGDSQMNRLLAHREQPIPKLRRIRPEVTEEFDAIFQKMVAKRVQDRYQTMAQVVSELNTCIRCQSTTCTIRPTADPSLLKAGKSNHKYIYAAIGAFLIILAGASMMISSKTTLPINYESALVEMFRPQWVGGGAWAIPKDQSRALEKGTVVVNETLEGEVERGYRLAYIIPPGANVCDFHGTACAFTFALQPRQGMPWVRIEGIDVIVESYQDLPRYDPMAPLPEERMNVYFVEIDKPDVAKTKTFTAHRVTRPEDGKRWDKFSRQDFEVVRLVEGKPEEFVVRVNAKTPGIYTFSTIVRLSYKDEVSKQTVVTSEVFAFDGIRN